MKKTIGLLALSFALTAAMAAGTGVDRFQAAFPDRVTRAADGTLLAVDRRAVTFAERRSSRIRYGINLFGRVGKPSPQSEGGGGGRGGFRAMMGAAQPAQSQPAPAPQATTQAGAGAPPAVAQSGRQGGGFDPARFAEMRTKFCATPQGEVPDLTGIPEAMLARLRGADGQIDPARIAVMRQRFCSADAAVPARVVCAVGELVGTQTAQGAPVSFQLGVDTGGQAPGTVTMRGAIGFGSAVPPAGTPITALTPGDAFFASDTNTANNQRNEATTLTIAGDLRLLKSATPDPVVGGGEVTYTLTVFNDGPSASTNFRVVDTLPAAATIRARPPRPRRHATAASRGRNIAKNTPARLAAPVKGPVARRAWSYVVRSKLSPSRTASSPATTATARSNQISFLVEERSSPE